LELEIPTSKDKQNSSRFFPELTKPCAHYISAALLLKYSVCRVPWVWKSLLLFENLELVFKQNSATYEKVVSAVKFVSLHIGSRFFQNCVHV